MSLSFHERVVEALRQGKRLAIATIIDSAGSTPRKEGARMAVLEGGELLDSIGGGALEALVVEDAKGLILTGGSMVREYLLKEGDEPGCTGMICGGRVRVHLQVELPPERLLIFGAGHVGAALAALTPALGFATTVLDDRPEFLEVGRFPGQVQLLRMGSGFSGDLPPVDASTYVAIVTRCHRTDLEALRRVLGTSAGYVGLIGSRRKVRVIVERLRREGFSESRLSGLRAPIGIPVGACTPEEIAVSIAAEMIQLRRGLVAPRSASLPVGLIQPAERHRKRDI
ncbi:MAG: XdhC/CoxI family protein [Acidobacteria bacterium]|nr:XdhC/CoxI family protein [Acidobacteriota bacterium]